MEQDGSINNMNKINIALVFITLVIGILIGNYTKKSIFVNDNETLLNEIRTMRDSLMTEINTYQIPDTTKINNYYINKYETESKIIINNSIDSNISYFKRWYESKSN